MSPEQADLFETALNSRPVVEKDEEIEVKPHARRKRKRYTDRDGDGSHFPPELERDTETLKPEGSLRCSACNKDKIEFSKKITEKLCIIPARFYVKKTIRPVYGCNCGSCPPVNAPAPDSALPKTVFDTSFLANMLSQKFAWHLPLNRQSQMMRELGLDIDRDLLISATNKLGGILQSIVTQMALEIRKCDLVHMDESPITVASRDSGLKVRCNKNSYYWLMLGGSQVVFTYTGNRRHCNVRDILGKDFSGILLSDGYKAYLNYCNSNSEASLALCWDHARRKFYELKDEDPLALEALLQLKKVYEVEKDIKKLLAAGELPPEKVPKYRKTHALPVLNSFKTWCETLRGAPEVLPKSKLFAACSYVLNHWSGLTLYLNNGIVPISNIAVEHQVRSLKLGAKNWLFAASEVGAETVATMNSLVCTCKINGINTLHYFNDILRRLDSDTPKALTPLAWKRELENIV